MTLCELLQTTKYTQEFHIYVTNDYDQNEPIGHGRRAHLLNADECGELFPHLLDKVDLISVAKNGALVVRVIDENYNEPLENQYGEDYVKRWDRYDPTTRPYKFSCELEDFN